MFWWMNEVAREMISKVNKVLGERDNVWLWLYDQGWHGPGYPCSYISAVPEGMEEM